MSEDKFTYSYSPAKNSEVDRIAAKYAEPQQKPDSDMERLRQLDRRAELPGTIAGIATGLFGILLLVGAVLLMSCDHYGAGIVTGIIALGLAAGATPVSIAVTKHSRAKYRDEILSLSRKIKGE